MSPTNPSGLRRNTGIVLASFVGDDAGVEQHPQVAAHGRWGATGCIRQFAGAHGPAAKELDDLATRGIRQGAEQSVDTGCHGAIVIETVKPLVELRM